MKPTKNTAAVVSKDDRNELLVVRRPEDAHGPLAGCWCLCDAESQEDTVYRVGHAKLGVDLKSNGEIDERLGEAARCRLF